MAVDRTMLERWARTHLRFEPDPGTSDGAVVRVDLARPLDHAALEPVRARLGGAAIAVVTAANPGARVASVERNARADGALRAAIDAAGLPAVRCEGCSPDETHREAGWAISCSEAEGLALARRFHQAGIFRLDADGARIVLADGGVIALPWRPDAPCSS